MAQQRDQLAVESGIPINNETVLAACGTCHATDDPNILSRISFRRTTPEGWQQTIKRMISLNDLAIEPEEAREVVQYLSNHLGLAPEEAKAFPKTTRTTPIAPLARAAEWLWRIRSLRPV